MPFFINISLIFFAEHLLNTRNSLYLYVEAKKIFILLTLKIFYYEQSRIN